MKPIILTCAGILGASIAGLFGGWDHAVVTLLIFMAIDYLTGLVVAGIFHKSPKSDTGALESKAGLKGLFRKGGVLLVVLAGARLDLLVGTNFVRDAVVIAFTVNETISITENLGLMGVPVPKPVTDAIELLRKKDAPSQKNG